MTKSKTMGERVNDRLNVLGFHDPTKPKFSEADLTVPAVGITDCSTEVLGTLYANYGVLVNYISGVVGDLDVSRIQAEHAYLEAKARAMTFVRDTPGSASMSVSEKKAWAEGANEVIDARRAMSEAVATCAKGQRMLDGYKTLWHSLSREISRRTGAHISNATFGTETTPNGMSRAYRQQENLRRQAKRR